MDAPTLTAIVPLHNKVRTIARTLTSIAGQTHPASEIIVVDDVSSDGSVEAVEELSIPNLRLLKRDRPGPGGYAARNLGAEKATGDWLAFLDADDEWLPTHLEAASRVIAQSPEVGVIFFGRAVRNKVTGAGEVRGTGAEGVQSANALLADYAERNLFHVNALIVRRDVFLETGGFNDGKGWRRGGDSELWLRLIHHGAPVYVSPEITSIYDMDFSDVIRSTKNFVREHPVRVTVRQMLLQETNPKRAKLLKRLATRKTVEWIAELPNRLVGTKLALLATIYPTGLSKRDVARLAKSIATRW
ncbi:MAG: glycosyltransferase [Pseudomonadota bacterium]